MIVTWFITHGRMDLSLSSWGNIAFQAREGAVPFDDNIRNTVPWGRIWNHRGHNRHICQVHNPPMTNTGRLQVDRHLAGLPLRRSVHWRENDCNQWFQRGHPPNRRLWCCLGFWLVRILAEFDLHWGKCQYDQVHPSAKERIKFENVWYKWSNRMIRERSLTSSPSPLSTMGA